MLKSYLKIAFRNALNQKLLSFINIFSLAFGAAACLIIFLFIQDEKSFDAFHSQSAQLYRLDEIQSFPGMNSQQVALSMPGMGPNLVKDYPEVLSYTRFWGQGKEVLRKNDIRYSIEKLVVVDSNFLNLFDFKLLQGQPNTALDEPREIVISEDLAHKFFPNENAIGKTLQLTDNHPYTISGVIEKLPENSHLQFDVLLSMATMLQDRPNFNEQFGSNYVVTYLLMDKSTDIASLENKMPAFLTRYMPPENLDGLDINTMYHLFFQPLAEVHLASMEIEHDYHNYRKFNGSFLNIFILIGIFILLIAAVNFMNLITARASHRWKEVGVRKTIGVTKSQLFVQFSVESILLSSFAFLLSLALAFSTLALINNLIDRELSFSYFFQHPTLLLIIFLLMTFLGFLAGIYPALHLASFKAIKILKGGNFNQNNSIFRNTLVVFQFGLAIAMIASTLIVTQQLMYMKNKDIGIDKNHIMLLDMNREVNNTFETLKTELLKSSHITGVTASGQRLGNNLHQGGFKIRTDSLVQFTTSSVNVEHDFLDVYDIKLKKGRNFSKDRPTDNDYAFIINESLAQQIGVENPIGIPSGQGWYPDDTLGTIIGVTEDFNFNSLHYAVNTLALVIHPNWGYSEMSIKVNGSNLEAAIADVERTWTKFAPNVPFEYSFLDEHFEELYRSDQLMETVVIMMAILAIIIACMGLFGLSVILAEQKIKEVGIRKILGASVTSVVALLSKSFIKLVLVALLIATPISWYVMNRWLENYAFHIDIQWWIFALAGVLAIGIAVLTVSFQSIKAALANPIQSLRSE